MSSEQIKLENGTAVAQLLIIPVLHPNLQQESDIVRSTEKGDGSFGSSNKLPNDKNSFTKTPQSIISPSDIELSQMTTSILHEIYFKTPPSSLEILDLKLTVSLPSDDNILSSIWQDVKLMERENFKINSNSISLYHLDTVDSHLASLELNEGLMSKYSETKPILQCYLINLSNVEVLDKDPEQKAVNCQFYEEAISEMCKKLAVVSVDFLRDKLITARLLAQLQQSDPYLNQIYELCLHGNHRVFKQYHLTNGVLFRRVKDNSLSTFKHCIALPDLLLSSVVHDLHHKLAHPSATATLKNFQQFYFNNQATKFIREYVRSCMTCNLAGKIDLKKIQSGDARTMNPTGPCQCMYADILYCPKGIYSFILFFVDAPAKML